MMLIEVDVPDSIKIARWREATLPKDWATYPSAGSTQKRGSKWAAAAKELAVWVPSSVVRSEWNCLINPVHHDIRHVRGTVAGPFHFDKRLRP